MKFWMFDLLRWIYCYIMLSFSIKLNYTVGLKFKRLTVQYVQRRLGDPAFQSVSGRFSNNEEYLKNYASTNSKHFEDTYITNIT